jgi:hypothetical protein
LLLLWFEGVYNLKGIAPGLMNNLPELESSGKVPPGSKIQPDINWRNYQAIIPLPFFHIGSENIWTDGTDESKKTTLLTSLKTGLPITGALLSRTSVSQTFMLDALIREPLQRLELVDYFTDVRPFLILKQNDYHPSDPEKWLLGEVTRVGGNDRITLYSLPVGTLKSIHEIRRREIISRFDSLKLATRNGLMLSDSTGYLKTFSYDHSPSPVSLRGQGAFSFSGTNWNLAANDTLSRKTAGSKMQISFWLYPYLKDGSVRSQIRISHRDVAKSEKPVSDETELFRHIQGYQGDWVLVEMNTETKFRDEILEISFKNSVIPFSALAIDEMQVRDANLDVWESDGRYVFYNNRRFQRR